VYTNYAKDDKIKMNKENAREINKIAKVQRWEKAFCLKIVSKI
jgi:hypothetical protein